MVQPFSQSIPIVDASGRLTPAGMQSLQGLVSAINGTTENGFTTSLIGGFTVITGRVVPEGAVTALPGAVYLNGNGGAGQTLWVKESGTGNTGWSAK